MKRYLAFMLAVICVFSSFFTANAFQIQYDGNVVDYNGSVFRLVVNGKEPELPLAPIIFNDRALVPVREVFEALDASVFYDERTKCIDISYDDNTVSLYINKSSAYINGKLTTIPDGITPKLIGRPGEPAKTMVPVRFISENLNMKVSFEDDTIVITSGDYIENEPPQSTPAPSPAPTPTPTPTPAPT